MNRILPKFKRRCRPSSSINSVSLIIFDQGIRRQRAKIKFFVAFSRLFNIFPGFIGSEFPKWPPKNFNFGSKTLAAASSLLNLTIIGAQRRPYGAKEPKKANNSNFNTGLSVSNKIKLFQCFLNMFKFFISFSCVGKLCHKRLALHLTHLTPRKELTQDKWRSLADLVLWYQFHYYG